MESLETAEPSFNIVLVLISIVGLPLTTPMPEAAFADLRAPKSKV